MVKGRDVQVQKVKTVPNKMDAKRHTPRHTIIKMPKVKDKESYKQQEKRRQLSTK